MDETEKQPLSERLLPRGTTRRQTARVGSQMAKDGRAYLSRLKTLWSVSEDHDDTGDPTANYGTWQADHRAGPDDLARQRSWAENHPEAAPIEVVIDAADAAEGVDGAAFSATMASITAQTYGSWRAVQIGEWVPTPDPRLIGVDDITDAVTLGDPNAIVLFVEAGDTLEPEAFFQLAARAWDNPTVDLFTWDDDVGWSV